ncbi:hypothetical protein [Dyadobacter pollutisoli]|uniref:Alpha-galactosidase n=1 Tax=Dyadobacter pollutisoli TaxID=2910158 RepID=A0A9E8N7A1_9BACT|nr:hypothetical protein [Dyadobacter pollutisoli]WAC10108.1 hypothetical protein ON006_20390 [Dyadobacter pollutisoli]
MKRSIRAIITVLVAMCPFAGSQAQRINMDNLPVYNQQALRSKTDWLITGNAQKSAIYKTPEGHMVLSNGLVSRTFTINPNGATIGLDNLITNEALVRAVSPEAVIWVNGQEINVGGLTGQPIGNYLLPEWISGMKADPYSLKLKSYTSSPIKERFEWNRRTEWSSQQLAWPPKGIEVAFTYRADEAMVNNFKNLRAQDSQREVLLKDDFIKLSPEWNIVSSHTLSNAFNNEGKAGEILAPSNAVVFGERALPEQTRVIICKLNSGTDVSSGYGPGVALQFAGDKSFKFHLSPANKRFRIFHDGKSEDFEGFDNGKSYFLKILLAGTMGGGKMICSVSEDGHNYKVLSEMAATGFPTHIRVGKTDPRGAKTKSNGADGAVGRGKIEQLLLLGEHKGADTNFDFLANLKVKVHYELYDGLPLISKWVSVENEGKVEFVVNNIKSEHLAVTEAESAVEHKQRWELPPIFAESDFAFGSMSPNAAQNACVEWKVDSSYTTQVNYALQTPSLLVCMPKTGMGQELGAGASFESMRLWELIYDSYDRERRGLSERKMYRTIAPWVTENPVIMHVSSAKDQPVKAAIDQCAEVGFEMVIMTFGSGFNLENTSPENLQRMKELKDYAKSKGIAIGGYSLLASRAISKENDVVMPAGKKPAFGNSPCLESEWGKDYFKKLYNFYETTGHDLLEHDGSYPGDVCASTTHPGHRGLEDSRWKQFGEIQKFYQWCRGKGIYLNIPDWYFLNGGTKIAMGYRETNWSLPREQQEIIERQNIYDGTWEKAPSMGWMFVPLVEYHGGGAAATIEPLKEHLPHYEQRLANLFGAGVQACYRGPQLYDAPETKAVVKKWVDFYKKHRRVLDSDIIHIRRPDGRDYDAIMHVDPQGKEKGLLMIYNPLNEPITREIDLDLYYTGLQKEVSILENDGKAKKVTLNGSKMTLKTTIPAKSQKWFVFAQ